ncbi:MAG TPA: hypothetical protein VMD08_18570, partial [Candidatus Baltobacteraceae bacterium]|nr:hypothetical protein [Candidatus Baltobacteraceae bacterium]
VRPQREAAMKTLVITGILWLAGAAHLQQPARLLRLTCFSPDSGWIAYSKFNTASDGDVSGQEFAFAIQQGRLVARYRRAAGEIGTAHPVDSLQVGASGDSVRIVVIRSDYSNVYRFHVTCRSLRGTAQLFRTAKSEGQVTPLVLRRARPTRGP